jgi:hypothetical protein
MYQQEIRSQMYTTLEMLPLNIPQVDSHESETDFSSCSVEEFIL